MKRYRTMLLVTHFAESAQEALQQAKLIRSETRDAVKYLTGSVTISRTEETGHEEKK